MCTKILLILLHKKLHMDKMVMCQKGYTISKIEKSDVFKAVEFVVKTNYKKHSYSVDYKQVHSEISDIVKTEMEIFENSCFYVATSTDGQIIGTLRVQVMKKSFIGFPLDFNLENVNNIYHIGRFAIDQINDQKLGSELFKRMILLAFSHVCQNKNNILVAECDMKLHRVLLRMGIDIIVLGPPFFCLGSETILIYAPYKNIIEYYSKYNLLQQL